MKKREEKQKPNKDYNPESVYKSFKRFPRNLASFYNHKYNAHKRYLIRMKLRNGDETDFYAFPKFGVFTYLGGAYIIDDGLKVYNDTAKCYQLSYHQDLSIPIRFDVDIGKTKEGISHVSDMSSSLNPAVLEQSQRSTVVQNMIAGASVPEMLKRILVIAVVTLVIVIGSFVLFGYKMGIFSGITGG